MTSVRYIHSNSLLKFIFGKRLLQEVTRTCLEWGCVRSFHEQQKQMKSKMKGLILFRYFLNVHVRLKLSNILAYKNALLLMLAYWFTKRFMLWMEEDSILCKLYWSKVKVIKRGWSWDFYYWYAPFIVKKKHFKNTFYYRFIDGDSYFSAVADALEAAQEEIFISDWW